VQLGRAGKLAESCPELVQTDDRGWSKLRLANDRAKEHARGRDVKAADAEKNQEKVERDGKLRRVQLRSGDERTVPRPTDIFSSMAYYPPGWRNWQTHGT
jgi:hypothetical protein